MPDDGTLVAMPHTSDPDILAWQEWQASTCSTSTIAQRTDAILRLTEYAALRTGRALTPQTITTEDISAWLARPGLGQASRATYANHLSSWFGWLHRTGRRPTDPMAEVRRPRHPTGIPRPLTRPEVDRVFAGANDRLRAVMMLALHAGLRVHEVARFRGEQIRGDHLEMRGKGAKLAYLPLAPALADFARGRPEGWWFPSPGGGHLSPNYLSTLVTARFRAVGIPTGSLHRLRHTYGTEVQRACGDIRVTQRLMRHASVTSTMIYTDVSDDAMARALAALPRPA